MRDAIFARLYAQLPELGWVGALTVVIVNCREKNGGSDPLV
jgi:hypothetical protein